MPASRTTRTRTKTAAVAILLGVGSMGPKGCGPFNFLADLGVFVAPANEWVDHVTGEPAPANAPMGEANGILVVRNGGTSAAGGFQSTPIDLFPPFRYEVTAGNLSSGPPLASGFFCTEADERGSSPLNFFTLCAQPAGDGFQVWAQGRGTGALNPTIFPATNAIDFAVEHDGAVFNLFARPTGNGEFTEIASLPHATTNPFMPSIGMGQVPPDAKVDFDAFRVVENGPLPGGATESQVLARAATDAGVEALHALDDMDDGVDPAVLAANLAAAQAALAEAEADVKAAAGELPDSKAARKAAKKLRAARKALARAQRAVEREKSAKGIWKSLNSGFKGTMEAAYLLDPRATPGSE